MRDSFLTDTPDDAVLLQRAQRRDPAAWADLYERFSGQLLGYFVHQCRDLATAEDLTSETFLEAIRAVHRFRGDLDDLRAWLFRIGRNNLIDHTRRRQRSPVDALEDVTEGELARCHPGADPGEQAIEAMEQGRLLAAVHALSPDQRDVVLLRLTGGLTSVQIGDIVGKTPGAVKALQHRALASLARRLTEQHR